MDLIEFLKARLDEDEAAARRATPGPWVSESSGPTGPVVMDAESRDARDHVARCPHFLAAFDAEHIARHDPARVLADVAAKRAIVERHTPYPDAGAPFAYCEDCGCLDCSPVDWPCANLRHLAAVYADHPDYRQRKP